MWTFHRLISLFFDVVSLTACEIAENWPHQGQYNIAYIYTSPFILHNVHVLPPLFITLFTRNNSSEHSVQK